MKNLDGPSFLVGAMGCLLMLMVMWGAWQLGVMAEDWRRCAQAQEGKR